MELMEGRWKGVGVSLSEPAADSCVTLRISLLLPGPQFLAPCKGPGRGERESSFWLLSVLMEKQLWSDQR